MKSSQPGRAAATSLLLLSLLVSCGEKDGNNGAPSNSTLNNDNAETNNAPNGDTNNTSGVNVTPNAATNNNTTSTNNTTTNNTTGPNNTTGTNNDPGMQVSVSAADGGTIEYEGSRLVIPPGALAQDTVVTVSARVPDGTEPDANLIDGMIYDFGPSGTEFAVPVFLLLPQGAAPADGEEKRVARRVGDFWAALGGGPFDDQVMTVIPHFSEYAVLLVTREEAASCRFTPCGGPVEQGSYTLAAACNGVPKLPNTYCMQDGDSWGSAVDISTGTLALLSDGTFTISRTFTGAPMLFWSQACRDAQAGTDLQSSDCDTLAANINTALYQGGGQTQCLPDLSGGCGCASVTQGGNGDGFMDNGTWMTEGTNINYVGMNGPYNRPYCVAGSALVDSGLGSAWGVPIWALSN